MGRLINPSEMFTKSPYEDNVASGFSRTAHVCLKADATQSPVSVPPPPEFRSS